MTWVPRKRSRTYIRIPAASELVALGARDGIELTLQEAEELQPVVESFLNSIDELSGIEVVMSSAVPLYNRDPGRRPSAAEDPWNAFIRYCEVGGTDSGPLAGRTIGVKDNIDVAGIPTTNASPMASYVPQNDAIVVERILAAGGRIVGKLNMDDWAAAATGETSAFGPPLNPVDPTRSAGGSSGGSGSAVRSGAVDFSLGGDQGGSARIPASYCGVVCMKATHGLIPSLGMTYLDHTIDSICPLARSVEDVALLLGVLAGDDGRDPQWVRGEIRTEDYVSKLQAGEPLDGVTAGLVVEGIGDDKCDAEVVENLRTTCRTLEDAGITVREVSIPMWSHGLPITQALVCHLAARMVKSEGVGYGHMGYIDVDRMHGYALRRRAESGLLPPYVKVWMLVERYLHEKYFNVPYGILQNLRLQLRNDIDGALQDVDVLITATTPTTAPPLLTGTVDAESVINRILQLTPYNTSPLNLSGHPAIAVPNGLDSDGMPTSAQFVTRRFEESLGLRVARIAELACS